MPLVSLTREGQTLLRRRGLLFGDPNTWKTSSLLTLPRPTHIVSYPGEHGYHTLLEAAKRDADLHVWIWETEFEKKVSSTQIVNEVWGHTAKILSGVFGDVASFAGDGIDKFHRYMIDSASGGAFFAGDTKYNKAGERESATEGLHYGIAEKQLTAYLNMVLSSAVPVVFMTCWMALEGDRTKKKEERPSDIPSHYWPALAGRLAKEITGHFDVTAATVLRLVKPGQPPEGYWQLKPDGDIWGCRVKCAPELAQKLPTYIKNDYRELERILNGA